MESAKPFARAQTLDHQFLVRQEHLVDGAFDLVPAVLARLQPQPDWLDAQEDDVGALIDQRADGRLARSFGADKNVEGVGHGGFCDATGITVTTAVRYFLLLR